MSRIRIRNLQFRYAGPAGFRLAIASLDVDPGECVAVVGPSGSGKTTLLNLLAGTLLPSGGEIGVGETRVDRLSETGRRHFRGEQVGQVFQAFELLDYLTVEENVLLPRRIDPAARVDAAAWQRAGELLATVGLVDKAVQRPSRLSHGERQRVAMGRAIVREPRVFLLDEPLSNLDAKLRVQMRTEIARLQRRLGTTTIYVTHDQTEAMTLGDRVAVLRRGEVLQIGTPRQLYEQPANLFVAGFIGNPAMNLIDGEVSGRVFRAPHTEIPVTNAPEGAMTLGLMTSSTGRLGPRELDGDIRSPNESSIAT